MISAPQIKEKKLIEVLNNLYSLKIKEISFVAGKGETSWGYNVVTHDSRYWLKIYNKKFRFQKEAAELTYKLFSKGHVDEIVHAVLSNSGKAVNRFEEYSFVLFNYIEGKEIMGMELTDTQREQLGILIGKIHKATEVIGEYPNKEIFESKDKEMFLRVIDRIKVHKKGETEAQCNFIQLLEPFHEKIIFQLISLKELSRNIKERHMPFVICHTDPNPANILLADDGKFYIIDWDSPMLAPKERDLFMFDKGITSFMKGYTSIAGQTEIDNEIREYYAREWNVQEIADFGEKILFENKSETDNEYYIERTKELLDYSGIAD